MARGREGAAEQVRPARDRHARQAREVAPRERGAVDGDAARGRRAQEARRAGREARAGDDPVPASATGGGPEERRARRAHLRAGRALHREDRPLHAGDDELGRRRAPAHVRSQDHGRLQVAARGESDPLRPAGGALLRVDDHSHWQDGDRPAVELRPHQGRDQGRAGVRDGDRRDDHAAHAGQRRDGSADQETDRPQGAGAPGARRRARRSGV